MLQCLISYELTGPDQETRRAMLDAFLEATLDAERVLRNQWALDWPDTVPNLRNRLLATPYLHPSDRLLVSVIEDFITVGTEKCICGYASSNLEDNAILVF